MVLVIISAPIVVHQLEHATIFLELEAISVDSRTWGFRMGLCSSARPPEPRVLDLKVQF